jgi:hypothetical protein
MHLKFKVFALFITHKLLVQISIFMYHNTTKNILQNMKIKMHVIQKSKQLKIIMIKNIIFLNKYFV